MHVYKSILLILLCTHMHLAKAQEKDYLNADINIAAQRLSIAQALEIISKQCGCYFSYSSELFNAKTITINPDFQGNIASFIQTYLGADLQTRIYKNQVILQASQAPIPKDSSVHLLQLSGRILDAETGQAIPYASVAIAHTLLGTSANRNGHFELKLSRELRDQHLEISCLGYHSEKRTIKDLATEKTIRLSPANISLQELVVRSVGSQYIVNKAIANFKNHYRTQAYNYHAFYREMAYRNEQHLSYVEALFQGYSPKNKAYRNDILALERSQKFSLAPSQQDSIILKLQGGTEAALQLDIVRHPTDFLSKERNDLYHYQTVDIKTWKEQLVYIIAFSPKNKQSSGYFQGELYISFEDYILLGADFQYTPQRLKQLKHSLVIHKSRGTKVNPQHYHYHIAYHKHQGLYHLNYVRGDIHLKAKHKQAWRYKNFHTSFEMVLTQIDLSATNQIKTKQKHKMSSVLSDMVHFTPQHFWDSDNIIVPEKSIMDAFQSSGFMIEAEE